MKKKMVLLTFVFLFSVSGLKAQLSVAPKLGMNVSNLGGDISVNKIRLRMLAGVTANYELNDMFSFQPGIQLSAKGATLDFAEDDNDAFLLDYLEIPLNAVLNVEIEDGILQVFAGPYLAFAVNGTYKYLADENNEKEEIFIGTSDDDEIKPLDFGVSLGLGYLFENIQVQAGYSGSISNISNYGDDDRLVNKVVFVSVAYFFELDL